MKTDCQDIQIDLLQGSLAHAAHLQTCADCRNFAAMLNLSSEVVLEDGEPNLQMDQAVLGYASQRRAIASPMPRRFIFSLVAAAAAVVAVAYLVTGSPTVDDGGKVNRVAENRSVTPSPEPLVDLASDTELSDMLRDVADADYSGDHIDDALLDLELQLAVLQTEAY